MNALVLSRVQFALTAMFHYIYPPLTIGMGVILFIMATLRLKRKEPVYDEMLRFWVHLFGINFAVGVATGIVLEFQFGTNWAPYSRFVGDIFGAPLAAEGIFSFFLESGFLAVLLFGWNRVSKRAHWFASLMVALGATLSAFWIIVANSWQQTPAGFKLADGRAELADFFAAVFNPSTLPRFSHAIMGAWVTGAFFVAGISAWYLLKGRHAEFARKSLAISIVFALVATAGAAIIGDWHTRQVAHTQPEKFAAMETLFKTTEGAPLLIIGYPLPEVGIPKLLSFMTYYDPNAKVLGLDAFPKEDIPPVAVTAMTFHAMVYSGGFLSLVALLGVWLLYKKTLEKKKWYLRLLVACIPLPFLLNELGWMTAEIGRQPWIVYHLLRTKDAYSVTVPAGQILTSIILFALLYAALFALGFSLNRKAILQGPHEGKEDKP